MPTRGGRGRPARQRQRKKVQQTEARRTASCEWRGPGPEGVCGPRSQRAPPAPLPLRGASHSLSQPGPATCGPITDEETELRGGGGVASGAVRGPKAAHRGRRPAPAGEAAGAATRVTGSPRVHRPRLPAASACSQVGEPLTSQRREAPGTLPTPLGLSSLISLR